MCTWSITILNIFVSLQDEIVSERAAHQAVIEAKDTEQKQLLVRTYMPCTGCPLVFYLQHCC